MTGRILVGARIILTKWRSREHYDKTGFGRIQSRFKAMNATPQNASDLDSTKPLTPVEQRAFDIMKPGVWYSDTHRKGTEELPFTIRRRSHVLHCLAEKGAIDSVVRLDDWRNLGSTYRVFQKRDDAGSGS